MLSSATESSTNDKEIGGQRVRHVAFISEPPMGLLNLWLDSGSQMHNCGYVIDRHFGRDTNVPTRSMKHAQWKVVAHGRRNICGGVIDSAGQPIRTVGVSDVRYTIISVGKLMRKGARLVLEPSMSFTTLAVASKCSSSFQGPSPCWAHGRRALPNRLRHLPGAPRTKRTA